MSRELQTIQISAAILPPLPIFKRVPQKAGPINMSKVIEKEVNQDFLFSQIAFEQFYEAVFGIDNAGNIIHVNKRATAITGYSRGELLQLKLSQLSNAPVFADFKGFWQQLSEEKRIINRIPFVNKGGQEYDIEAISSLVQVNGKTFCCLLVNDLPNKKTEGLLLRTISEATSAKIGQDFFEALARYITIALNISRCIISECIDVDRTRVRTLAYTKNKELVKNVEYDVEGTPCKLVMQGRGQDVFIPTGCDIQYPREAGYDSFIAVPINSPTTGDVIGHIAAFDTGRMTSEHNQTSILRIFASRAGAELDRLSAQRRLEKANEELSIRLKEIEALKNQLQAENKYLQEEIKLNNNFEEIISRSKKFKRVLSQIEQVAATDSTVLIMGESGTGKELLARAVHNISNRNKKPLVKVNCATLPANLIESELFGHEKGAFTGAMDRKIGRFELADGGTIFLDEIGELPVELQAKLLRVLQEGEFERLGNPRTMKVNVRVIAATNRNLEQAIENKEFREDLYYRLNVFPIVSPPLRERKEDIPLLVKHFCQKHEAKIGKKIIHISPNVIDDLMSYDWPGNIRELENLIERALILTRGNTLERGEWLPEHSTEEKSGSDKLEDVEKQHILEVLNKAGWKVSGDKGAAKILGLNATTLEARMKKLGIKRDN